MIYIVFGVAIALLVLGYGWIVYNRITELTNNINEGWANIAVALKKRHNVVPLLVAAVKGSKEYEQLVQRSLVALRNQDIRAVSEAERHIQKETIALVEAHPNMKTDKAFGELIDQLVVIEDELQGNRLLFNRAVALYLRQIGTFPAAVFAVAFGFSKLDFFEVDPSLK